MLGEGGIIDSARKAGEATNAAIANEQQMLQNVVDWANNVISGNGGSTNTEKDPPTEEKTTDEMAEEAENWIGQEVEYGKNSNNSSKNYNWRIFYVGKINDEDESEENHIYIIADDYIEFNDAPTGKNNTPLTKEDEREDGKSYQLGMSNVINDYTGTSDITDEALKKLNNDYFNEEEKKYSSTEGQGKALAFMMDTTMWGQKFGGNLTEYVIGGPTIELLFKAYNKKNGLSEDQEYKAEAFDETESGKGRGYKIARGNSEFNYATDGETISCLNTEYKTFVITDTNKSEYMWVSSPSCYDKDNLIEMIHNGNLLTDSYSNIYGGFRPLICLKSNVKITKQEDNTWKVELQS